MGICFTAQEFLNVVPSVPERGFVLWDEPGTGLGHRKLGSPENIAVTEIFQAFRLMFVNVCFAVPRRGLIDKTARLLLHLEFKMQGRGYALVYRIISSDWGFEGIVTPFVGHVRRTGNVGGSKQMAYR